MRVKRGVAHIKRRHNILEATKGFKWGRKNRITLAKTAAVKAGVYAYRDRKNKKRDFRALWNIRISAAVRPLGLSYSRFIGVLKKEHIELDRKILSTLAKDRPEIFAKIVAAVKK